MRWLIAAAIGYVCIALPILFMVGRGITLRDMIGRPRDNDRAR